MWKISVGFLIFSGIMMGQQRPDMHHILGVQQPLTGSNARPVREIAHEYTVKSAAQIGLNATDMNSLYIAKEYTDDHNGVTHIVYKQQFGGLEVYNAAWAVNLDSAGRVLNAGGELYGMPTLAPPSSLNSLRAVRAAVTAVNSRIGAEYQPTLSRKIGATRGQVSFSRGELGDVVDGHMVWFAVRGALQPAWVFFVTDEDGVSTYASIVDDLTGLPLLKQSMTYFQNPNVKGLVYERGSPNPLPQPGTLVTESPALVERTLQSFAGDPLASPVGWVTANSTRGNNAVVGENLLGIAFLETPQITTAKDGDFSFPISLGAGALPTSAFTDAVNTNLFYWVNRAHDLHYLSGFTEAAGNFQLNNFGRGGSGGDPLYAYTHYGTQTTSRAALRNAVFTYKSHADGSQPMIAMYLSHTGTGGYYTDGALDANVIVHEYTHGVSNRLMPNGYGTFQEGAMGEAWSDFFGLEYTLAEGAPVDGIYPSGEYFYGAWGKGIRTRPYTTDMKLDPLTYADLGSVISFPEVHADGEIWMAALWDIRANLIKQFGEREGRRRSRVLLLDGMKFMPPASTMIDARDAILLADRVDYKGASQDQLWTAFAKRGMGATAYSWNGTSVHIAASYELPSNKARIAFFEPETTVGESLRVLVSDNNNPASSVDVQFTSSTGDLETLQLRRVGSVFIGSISTSSNIVIKENGVLNLIPGDFASVYHIDNNTGSGKAEQVNTTIPVRPAYFASSIPAGFDTSGTETFVQSGQRVELPFEFRFFEKSYRGVYVDRNGLLYFTDTFLTPCTDLLALRTLPAIAPFWMQLSTTGFVQPREGIYYSKPDKNSIRFRWAAETATAFGIGTPVNFSTTLFDDGSITFNYGTGNTDLVNAIAVAGCNGAVSAPGGPTVGLSPGHDTYAYGTFIKQSWTSPTGLRFEPPFNASSIPTVILQSPKEGDKVQDTMTVTGVAYDTETSFSRVYILIDGVQFGSATASLNRADFCATQNVRGCPFVGFSLLVNTSALAPGQHTLQLRGVNARGTFVDSPELPITFTVEAGQGRMPFGKLELPLPDAEVSGTLTVRGYAAIHDLRVLSVDTLIDGVTFGPTTYGLTRTDICTTLKPVPLNCPGIGFQVIINTRTGVPPIQDGEHTLQIRVRDEAGRFFILPDATVKFRVNNGGYQPTAGAITSIKNGDTLKGTVTIAGYAYSPTSRIIAVSVVYDGRFGDVARYGVASPEVCATLPDVTACPNIGWTFELDTRRLANGNHLITVSTLDSNGVTLTLPTPAQGALNVNVQN